MKTTLPCTLPLLIALACAACDDSGLGGGLLVGDGFTPGDAMVPPSMDPAITVGSQLHLWFVRFYDKDFDTSGTTTNERQATGHMCTRITAIDDGYATNSETTVATQMKVSGVTSGTDIYINGTDDASPIPNQLDEASGNLTVVEVADATQNLWLSRITPQIRGHGYLTEASLTCQTQQAFTPPDQSLSRLLFFDVRRSDDGLWGGWTSDGSVVDAQSFVGKAQTYFLNAPYSTAFFLDPTLFKENHNEQGSGCGNFTDSTQCQVSGCSWDFGANVCALPNLVVELVWRETLAVGPPDLIAASGKVIHSIRMEYLRDGTLKAADEYVIKDQLPATTDLDFLSGCAQGPCALGFVKHHRDPWSAAPCRTCTDASDCSQIPGYATAWTCTNGSCTPP